MPRPASPTIRGGTYDRHCLRGRDYTNKERLYHVMDEAVTRLGVTGIIEGECPTEVNADKLARDWAVERGIDCQRVPAERRNGKLLGAPRNHMMLTMLLRYRPQNIGVIAFPGGTGTHHMKNIARAAGVDVYEVPY